MLTCPPNPNLLLDSLLKINQSLNNNKISKKNLTARLWFQITHQWGPEKNCNKKPQKNEKLAGYLKKIYFGKAIIWRFSLRRHLFSHYILSCNWSFLEAHLTPDTVIFNLAKKMAQFFIFDNSYGCECRIPFARLFFVHFLFILSQLHWALINFRLQYFFFA